MYAYLTNLNLMRYKMVGNPYFYIGMFVLLMVACLTILIVYTVKEYLNLANNNTFMSKGEMILEAIKLAIVNDIINN